MDSELDTIINNLLMHYDTSAKINGPKNTRARSRARWKLQAYIKRIRIEEVDAYADYLSDLDNEAAFEQGWQSYGYRRIREIDAEGSEDE